MASYKTVLVCQSKACRKGGSEKVLDEFQAISVTGIEVIASPCLGQCGNGPIVLILPDEIWYNRVSPEEVPAVGDRHLRQGIPVRAMLYHKFHS